jgi:acetolactate synthase I/II/III large subunit
MKASDYIAEFLGRQGVTHVFEVVGGMISHLVDSMYVKGSPKLVSMHHEQAAGFAADVMGRITGVPGVAMATSGPGGTNLLTGVGSAHFDSSPTVFITGQVNREEKKGTRPIRQLGFQEADIVSMAKPITKAAWSVDDPTELPAVLCSAFELSTSGRPGAVLLDIPMDVQRAQVTPVKERNVPQAVRSSVEKGEIMAMLDSVRSAERPLILVGGGVRAARAVEDFSKFVNMLGIPVVCSLMGLDAITSDDKKRIGLIGTYGNRWANMALGHADVLIVIGSRLDIRQTGADTEFFKGDRIIYHIDCERGEVNNRVTGCVPIFAHIAEFLRAANAIAVGQEFSSRDAWLKEILAWKDEFPDTSEIKDIDGINPNLFMHKLSACSKDAAAFISDVGQHQMWAAQSLTISKGQRFITSGGMGAMGFGLPGSIGACFALPNLPVVMIAGDGSFQLNIQELETVTRNNLPLKMLVLNNKCHGMARQFQESYFSSRFQSTMWGYSAPDFAAVAKAYGIDSGTVIDTEDVENALAALWSRPCEPYLLQVMIDSRANAYPKIAFGYPLTEMEPHAKPLAMEAT